jgi:hypothetical protein
VPYRTGDHFVTRGAARVAPPSRPVIGYNFARLIDVFSRMTFGWRQRQGTRGRMSAVPSMAVAPVPPFDTGSLVPAADVSRCSIYSITSSARASSDGGIVSPNDFAVFRLMTSSVFVDCWTGRSAGLSPLRIRPAEMPSSR